PSQEKEEKRKRIVTTFRYPCLSPKRRQSKREKSSSKTLVIQSK
ncbi:hypothetical protein HMPREF3202_01497, partial [Prevotella bivia]